jgi:D-3-phosphoglycerate dehydrogenase / 2-oxoglutarate reductase
MTTSETRLQRQSPGRANVALFERWAHPVANDMLAQRDNLIVTYMSLGETDPINWSVFEQAHVYQARSTRSELPEQYWPGEGLLARCPNLLAVSTNGSGSDTVDLDACTAAGVLVVNQAGGNKQGVAEHAIGMMLCLSKRIIQADRAMRTVANLEREKYMGNDSHGKTLGIVGMGHVGSHVAALASGMLSMQVLGYDPFLSDEEIARRGAEPVTLDALLARSDVVTVHCPRNSRSENMLDAAAFAKMKRSAYFITTARGGIHNELALAEALRNDALAGAGLDVWEDEPPSLDHPLLAFDNVLVSPHTAGVTHESRSNVVRGTVEQIDAIARGQRPPRLLNPDVWPAYVERHTAIRGAPPES